ncbi:rhomboid family intramembrane serine protease [Chryseolinea lacunae]|uniref:Rhomboid family intramembrane serine protease n=1 Tax=Chryseolinea lacunae TaxID=2801331 RepID=A0ABS1KSN4_9BACT|nr:rhomboid family intramembrane serine protease [Chryseolinea lacunae]MBL0742470.1 rhomboid family intramembrane serine protease [Chryseolinea lacunae]
MLRLTPVVRSLIMINVIVFVAAFLAGSIMPQVDIGYCFGMPGAGSDDLIHAYLSLFNVKTDCFKPYQLFTYMFVHGGFMHIFFNMLSLAFMGPILETYWGTKRFTIFYLVCGIGAGIFNIFIDQFLGLGSFSRMVGASGAIYGILMGFGMMFPNMEVQLLIPPIPVKAKYLVFILGALNYMMDPSGNTAHFAHLGGVVFAYFLVTAWKREGGNY